jgi:Domain of unknown function (DUF4440)
MKNFMMAGIVLLLGVAFATAHQSTDSDEAGRVLALEKVWNRALEQKDTKALELLLANTVVSVETDGSLQSKSEFLASIKAPEYQLAQAVNESMNTAPCRSMEIRRWWSASFASREQTKASRSYTVIVLSIPG